ncbi:NlpC/P60 family protein [Luteipulveratus sp. YIM 133132]|uniref:C40 family peptidase n=1 Tax=Luteipulveratus flavus TaxID=3031728 RepID=UPI0023AF9323|nr:NlpC/P60 family protein [Luteipulveratus sp. YIM 133132]MDE9365341.1 NlpC/P60 family protein [Luteipulveratus sp. YIM 133132]
MTYAPRHRKAEPTLASAVVSSMAGRHSKALTGVALAIPTAIGGIGMADAAQAAPVVGTPQAAAQQVAATAAASTPAAVSATSAAAALPTAYRAGGVTVLSYGDRGSLVKVVQGRLHISRDGSFGPQTRRAVKGFQARKGLAADGYVGPKTWRALGGYPGGTATATTARASRSASISTSSNSSVVRIAQRYLGVPYVYGGSTPSGFDCSGLTSYVFRQIGKELPRSARAQQAAVTRVSSPRVGDLVFYGYPAHHVGIYVGNGQMIDAPKPGMRVNQRAVYQPEVSSYGRV